MISGYESLIWKGYTKICFIKDCFFSAKTQDLVISGYGGLVRWGHRGISALSNADSQTFTALSIATGPVLTTLSRNNKFIQAFTKAFSYFPLAQGLSYNFEISYLPWDLCRRHSLLGPALIKAPELLILALPVMAAAARHWAPKKRLTSWLSTLDNIVCVAAQTLSFSEISALTWNRISTYMSYRNAAYLPYKDAAFIARNDSLYLVSIWAAHTACHIVNLRKWFSAHKSDAIWAAHTATDHVVNLRKWFTPQKVQPQPSSDSNGITITKKAALFSKKPVFVRS